jgi:transglutaminase-like putative cysteine protease
MRISVAHESVYRYDPAASGVIQSLRLTPRNHAGQYVVSWRIDISADCRLEAQEDAFGNVVHAFSVDGPLSELRVLAEGMVETQDTAGVVRGAVERFPPSLFARETPLTAADEAIAGYAAQFAAPVAGQSQTQGAVPVTAGGAAGDGTLPMLHALLARLHQDMALDHELAVRTVENTDTAAAAFARRRGACQDVAHVFIAVARSLGVPTRYVSGYFPGADGMPGSSHAWAEAYVPDLGWVGFDPAYGFCVTDQHVRVAIGLDAIGAAPVRVARYGGGGEAVEVHLAVSQANWQAQG